MLSKYAFLQCRAKSRDILHSFHLWLILLNSYLFSEPMTLVFISPASAHRRHSFFRNLSEWLSGWPWAWVPAKHSLLRSGSGDMLRLLHNMSPLHRLRAKCPGSGSGTGSASLEDTVYIFRLRCFLQECISLSVMRIQSGRAFVFNRLVYPS